MLYMAQLCYKKKSVGNRSGVIRSFNVKHFDGFLTAQKSV